MAQIFAFGRVENDLAPKKSQKDSTYVCFGFTEQTGKGSSSITRYGHGRMKYPALPGLVSKGQPVVDHRHTAAGGLHRRPWKGTDKNPEGLSFQFRISSGPHPQRKLH